MFVETELAKSIGDPRDDQGRATPTRSSASAPSAPPRCSSGASGAFVTRQGIQLHGGIGVTDEHDVGLYFKRMHILGTLFGDEAFHIERFANGPSFIRVASAG